MATTVSEILAVMRVDSKGAVIGVAKATRDLSQRVDKGLKASMQRFAKALKIPELKNFIRSVGNLGRALVRNTPLLRALSQGLDGIRLGARLAAINMREFFTEMRSRGLSASRELADAWRQMRPSLADLQATFPGVTAGLRRMRDTTAAAVAGFRQFGTEVRERGVSAMDELRKGARELGITWDDFAKTMPGLARGIDSVSAGWNRASDAARRLGPALRAQLPDWQRIGPHAREVGRAFNDLVPGFARLSAGFQRARASIRESEGGFARIAAGARALTSSLRGAGPSVTNFFRSSGKAAEEADGKTRGLLSSWGKLPHGARQFAFYVGLFTALGQSIAILGAATGGGLAILGGAAVALGAGVGVAIAAFMGLNQEISTLPAAVQPAAAAFQSLGDSFSALQDRIQGAAAGGLAVGFQNIKAVVDSLGPVLEQFGAAFGAVFANITAQLSASGFQTFLQGSIPIFSALVNAAFQLGAAIGNIFILALPYIQQFSTWLQTITTEFAAWTASAEGASSINTWLQGASDVLASLGPLLAAAGQALNSLVTPATIASFVQLVGTLTNIMPLLGSILQIAGNLNIFGILAQLIEGLGTALSPLMPALMQFGTILGQLVSGALAIIVPLLGSLMTAFAPLLEMIVNFLGAALQPLLGALELLLQPLITVANTLLAALMPAFQMILDVIVQLIPAFLPLVAVVGSLIAAVAPLVEQLVAALMPAFQMVIEAIMPLIQMIMPVLIELLNTVIPIVVQLATDFIGQLLPAIMPIIEALMRMIQKVLPPLLDLLDVLIPIIGTVLKGAFDFLLPAIMGIVNALSSILIPIIDTVTDVLSGLIKFLVGVFTGNWEQAWQGIVDIFSGLFNGIVGIAEGVMNGVIDLINGLIEGINAVAGAVGISIGSIPHVNWNAAGAIINGPTLLQGVGEAGPEAIVPLRRPLSQVDPSVRGLSAIAQGLSVPAGAGTNVTVESGAIVVQGTEDAAATANETVNRLAERIGSK